MSVAPGDIVRGQRLRTCEVVGQEGALVEAVFERSTLVGPAVVLPERCQFVSCTFLLPESDIEAILWPWPHTRAVYGCLKFEACLFDRCRFELIGFTGSAETLELLRGMYHEGGF